MWKKERNGERKMVDRPHHQIIVNILIEFNLILIYNHSRRIYSVTTRIKKYSVNKINIVSCSQNLHSYAFRVNNIPTLHCDWIAHRYFAPA